MKLFDSLDSTIKQLVLKICFVLFFTNEPLTFTFSKILLETCSLMSMNTDWYKKKKTLRLLWTDKSAASQENNKSDLSGLNRLYPAPCLITVLHWVSLWTRHKVFVGSCYLVRGSNTTLFCESWSPLNTFQHHLTSTWPLGSTQGVKKKLSKSNYSKKETQMYLDVKKNLLSNRMRFYHTNKDTCGQARLRFNFFHLTPGNLVFVTCCKSSGSL